MVLTEQAEERGRPGGARVRGRPTVTGTTGSAVPCTKSTGAAGPAKLPGSPTAGDHDPGRVSRAGWFLAEHARGGEAARRVPAAATE